MIPRTFSFDKYRFLPGKGTERVSATEALRPVSPGAHADIKRDPKVKERESRPEREDYFREEELFPRDLSKPYLKIRSLWDPREDQALLQKPLKLMVGIEDSPSRQDAVRAAVALAKKYRCPLLLAKITADLPGSPEYEIETRGGEKILEQVRRWMAADYLKKHPPTILLESHEDPAQGLLKIAHRENCSLLIVGIHNKNLTQLLQAGTVSGRVLKAASCPVLIWRHPKQPGGFKRVLVPIDGTPFSYHAIVQAIILCQDFGADLFLFHVSENEGERERKNSTLGMLMNKMDWKNIKHDLVTETGDVLKTIVNFCKNQQIDLVVMGTHPLDLAGGTAKGSITAEVVQQVNCPVFVVHPQH